MPYANLTLELAERLRSAFGAAIRGEDSDEASWPWPCRVTPEKLVQHFNAGKRQHLPGLTVDRYALMLLQSEDGKQPVSWWTYIVGGERGTSRRSDVIRALKAYELIDEDAAIPQYVERKESLAPLPMESLIFREFTSPNFNSEYSISEWFKSFAELLIDDLEAADVLARAMHGGWNPIQRRLVDSDASGDEWEHEWSQYAHGFIRGMGKGDGRGVPDSVEERFWRVRSLLLATDREGAVYFVRSWDPRPMHLLQSEADRVGGWARVVAKEILAIGDDWVPSAAADKFVSAEDESFVVISGLNSAELQEVARLLEMGERPRSRF